MERRIRQRIMGGRRRWIGWRSGVSRGLRSEEGRNRNRALLDYSKDVSSSLVIWGN